MFAGFIFSPILCSIYKESKGHKDCTSMTIVKTDAEFSAEISVFDYQIVNNAGATKLLQLSQNLFKISILGQNRQTPLFF